jgi:hypothetical protein
VHKAFWLLVLSITASSCCCIPLQVLMSCMSSFASIVVLLVLFWLVFSIMGLHVFGGLKLDEPWPNCDDMINSLILNFNVRALPACCLLHCGLVADAVTYICG